MFQRLAIDTKACINHTLGTDTLTKSGNPQRQQSLVDTKTLLREFPHCFQGTSEMDMVLALR